MKFIKVKSAKLRRVITKGDASGISPVHMPRLLDAVYLLRTSTSIKDVPPEWKLHVLEKSKGRRLAPERLIWSMWVSAQWRLTFRIEDNAICDLDFLQYH